MTTVAIRERDMEKIAWSVLLGSFGICLLLFFGAPVLSYVYMNSATDSHESDMTVLSGTVIVDVPGRDPTGERGTRMVPEGATIRTDANSRVNITLFDGSTVIVFPDTQVTLSALRSPKFTLSSLPPQLRLELPSGRLRVSVTQNGGPHEVKIQMPQGESWLRRGEYLMETTREQAEIVVRNGQSLVKAREAVVTLNGRERSLVLTGEAPRGPLPAERDLIVNGNFAAPLTDGWVVYNDQGGDGGSVNGTITLTSEQGRRGARFQRQGSNGNHDDTGIEQPINKDVGDADIIRLRADVLVNHQSLSGGGYLSSEYPLMVKIRYRDVKGGENFWVHGFYYQNDAHNPTVNGEQVPRGLWYPYESPDLTDILNPKPAQILSVQIYASGWDFDSMVADTQLIVE